MTNEVVPLDYSRKFFKKNSTSALENAGYYYALLHLLSSFFDSICQSILSFDKKLSYRVFYACQNSGFARLFSRCISLSGDEIVLFIAPVICGSLLAIYEGGPHAIGCTNLSCELELILDLFGAMTVSATVEQLLKLFFQRRRPSYLVKRKPSGRYWCLWGEWYSFPSGHSMRCFYFVTWLFFGQQPSMYFDFTPGNPGWMYTILIVWAAAVGNSRVAIGKHYHIDVVAGAIFGVATGFLVEKESSDSTRVVIKALCGISAALQVSILLLAPIVHDFSLKVTRRPLLSKIVTYLFELSFYTFYLMALYSFVFGMWMKSGTVECPMGRFSYKGDDDGYDCKFSGFG